MFTFDQQKGNQKPSFVYFKQHFPMALVISMVSLHKGTNRVGLLVDMSYLGQKDRENESRLGTWHLTEVNFCSEA